MQTPTTVLEWDTVNNAWSFVQKVMKAISQHGIAILMLITKLSRFRVKIWSVLLNNALVRAYQEFSIHIIAQV